MGALTPQITQTMGIPIGIDQRVVAEQRNVECHEPSFATTAANR